ncbi:MAG: hypothetical protein QOJ15_5598 [Bradyrhizobium sp.]|jgi:hypothetical protein|nr:hypothetical protein [Bradyrhizobium sp.]
MFDPDGRTRFKAFRFSLRVEAQAERVAVIIANNPLGLPGDKDFGAFLLLVALIYGTLKTGGFTCLDVPL